MGFAGPNGYYKGKGLKMGHKERRKNMEQFAQAALELLLEALNECPPGAAKAKL